DIRPNRINIDTGAFATGRLTCLRLEGDAAAFIAQRRDGFDERLVGADRLRSTRERAVTAKIISSDPSRASESKIVTERNPVAEEDRSSPPGDGPFGGEEDPFSDRFEAPGRLARVTSKVRPESAPTGIMMRPGSSFGLYRSAILTVSAV